MHVHDHATRDVTVPPIELLVPGFTPENDLESRAIHQPELLRGLAWGAPRWGHPEGRVGEHVGQILTSIAVNTPLRAELRFIALVHDSFKYCVRPRSKYSPENDHAVLARRFAQRFASDEAVLATIELHDEPYYIWHRERASAAALTTLIARIPDPDLFLAFVELDASTEGKDPRCCSGSDITSQPPRNLLSPHNPSRRPERPHSGRRCEKPSTCTC